MILTLLLSIVLHVGDSLYVNESRICEQPDAQHMAVIERLDSVIEFKLFDLTDHAFYGWERFSAWDGRRFTRTGWQECFDKNGNLTLFLMALLGAVAVLSSYLYFIIP